MTKKILFNSGLVLMLLFASASIKPAQAQVSVFRNITFPVVGTVSYVNDFGNVRSGDRTHEGNDIMGKKMMPLVAAVDGTVTTVIYPEATWGYSISLRDSDGYKYNYLHINNDNPGTDDGHGGGFHAYAPDMVRSYKVVKGQLIGWMGDSGNAETTSAHLHFEIQAPDGTHLNPYESLKAAVKITAPVADYPKVSGEILPYENFSGGASIAMGKLDGDTNLELVSGARAGGGPLVRTFDLDGKPLKSWYAYADTFRGGVDVAVGDVSGDSTDEVVTAPGPGGGPHIKIFKANGTELLKEFFAYDPNFHGGVNVTVADVAGDDDAEIITAPASLGGAHVKIFKFDGTLLREFMAYDESMHTGIDVAAAVYGRNTVRIITAPAAGSSPQVKVFDEEGKLVEDFLAYDASFMGGVRVGAARSSTTSRSQLRIITSPASGGGPHVRIFDSDGDQQQGSLTGYEQWWVGGYDVTGRDNKWFMSSLGGRRTSLRQPFKTTTDSTRYSR